MRPPPPPLRPPTALQVLSALERSSYDIILMDIHMPEMDGLEASRRIRDMYAPHERPRIIALSADTLQGLHDRCGSEIRRSRCLGPAQPSPARPSPLPSSPTNQHHRRCRDAGVEEFLVKPFRVEDLRRVVRCAPRRPSAGPSAGDADAQPPAACSC
jgi:CheY-like chemotaxis protein